MKKEIMVMWQRGPVAGKIDVFHGTLAAINGKAGTDKFSVSSSSEVRLLLKITDARVSAGACPTRVTVNTRKNPFTFFLRDVTADSPIFIPEYGLAVVPAGDKRTYAEVADQIRKSGLVSQLAEIEKAPEETYEDVCRENRNQVCPTWLGLSRDMRFFEVNYDHATGYWGYIRPRYHSIRQRVPEMGDRTYSLNFVVGPGSSCRVQTARRLEDGVLPILHSTQSENDIRYDLTIFATLETQPVSAGNLRGSEWQACYANTGGMMFKQEELARIKDLVNGEMRNRAEETVCWIRIEAVNNGSVPRYAWFRGLGIAPDSGNKEAHNYDGKTGFAEFASTRVFGVHRLNGKAAPNIEMAILLKPGAKAVYDILVPHQPIPANRAKKLARQTFSTHLTACRKFWKEKLQSASSISVPEPAIDERIKAGLLHCDLVALGKEPHGPVLATIGWYAPIGSESSPIIQFFDSMGWHKLAERCLEFFLKRQREDGFIQNFGGYQLETGPALWTMGEHYRYTGDKAWVRRIKPNLLKACDYLLAWRERNKRADLRGKGYGLLDGKVADPEDFFHSFMLNGLSYLGIKRVAEMLARIDPAQSKRLAAEAAAFKKDIRVSYYESVGRSPAIPLSDGTWVPSAPPWTENPGALALYADGGNWFTHGAFGARDSLIGSLYLVISEVLDAGESGADFLLKSHQQLFTVKNAGLSQPYYCRHDYIHLARGEVKAFLKTYYNQFTALQDRETYTFWEHYFGASQHKTHEEGWFLMQTRWMLWLEEGNALSMLKAIPRRWLEDGKTISLKNVATYFGPVSLHVESKLAEGLIRATMECRGTRKPKEIRIRLPHPDGRKAVSVLGGIYDAATETVVVRQFMGKTMVEVRF
ncbi:MAG: hypothetical protein C0404_10380 [Verrucomicrobia bacterium]|nr:hypothetical protein [Verrucomicrobiota bacterium]